MCDLDSFCELAATIVHETNLATHMIDILKVFIPALLGVFTAFQLNRWQSIRNELRQSAIAGKKAQFALIRQQDTLSSVVRQALDDGGMRSNPEREFQLLPFHRLIPEFPLIDYGSLAFMFEDKEYPDLLHKISISEELFVTAMETLNIRNNQHENLQTILGRGGSPPIDLRIKLKDMTDQLYDNFDVAVSKNKEIFPQFRDYLKSKFPKIFFYDVEYLDGNPFKNKD